jgi:hypothetical protein
MSDAWCVMTSWCNPALLCPDSVGLGQWSIWIAYYDMMWRLWRSVYVTVCVVTLHTQVRSLRGRIAALLPPLAAAALMLPVSADAAALLERAAALPAAEDPGATAITAATATAAAATAGGGCSHAGSNGVPYVSVAAAATSVDSSMHGVPTVLDSELLRAVMTLYVQCDTYPGACLECVRRI